MAIAVEAVYEAGVLRPTQPLPLAEQTRVRVVIEPAGAPSDDSMMAAERSYGLLQWTGDAETLRRLAEDDAFGL